MNIGILTAVLVALGTGVVIALQGPMNSLLTRHIGLLESAFIVLISGAVVVGAALLLGLGSGSLGRLGQAPLVSLLGGVIGIFILIGVVMTIDRLGVTAGLAIILVAQLSVGSVIDHFGLFGVPRNPAGAYTFLGIGLLVAGAVLIRR